jgi:hypothetical protein
MCGVCLSDGWQLTAAAAAVATWLQAGYEAYYPVELMHVSNRDILMLLKCLRWVTLLPGIGPLRLQW